MARMQDTHNILHGPSLVKRLLGDRHPTRPRSLGDHIDDGQNTSEQALRILAGAIAADIWEQFVQTSEGDQQETVPVRENLSTRASRCPTGAR